MINKRKQRMLGRRLLQTIPIMILATFIVFSLMYLIPGDIAVTMAGDNATDERIEQIRELYGLNQPFLVQYGDWLWGAVRGDLGVSLLTSEAVATTIARVFPNTLLIVVYAIVISALIGIPLGILAAARPGSRTDSFVMSVASLGVAVPNFWFGMILVMTLALGFGLFPTTGFVSPLQNLPAALWYATLPAIALSTNGIAEIARQLRSSLVELHASQQVRTLHAKGLSPAAILWKHGLKNVSVNLLTVVGLLFNKVLAATVVVETVFAIPGMGRLLYDAVTNGDTPVMQAAIVCIVALTVIITTLTDVLYALINPTVRSANVAR